MREMSYQLAKRLKDAGWPQHQATQRPYISGPDEEEVRDPTLDELIEGCPLTYTYDGMDMPFRLAPKIRDGVVTWHAGYVVIGSRGSTRKEAVAELWLKLQAKGIV